MYDIIHPERRNLTAIRGYKRLGGLPDDPHTDPQDKNWYGPHDRLFVPEEDEVVNFQPGPKYGESTGRASEREERERGVGKVEGFLGEEADMDSFGLWVSLVLGLGRCG